MNGSRTVVFVLYALFFLATNWPILIFANRIDPKVGPFPFLVFWMLFWSIGIGIVHLLYGLCCLGDPKIPERTTITWREEDRQ
jgi:hypothetical protein